MDPARFRAVTVPPADVLSTTKFAPAETNESNSRVDGGGLIVEPEAAQSPTDAGPPQVDLPAPEAGVINLPQWRAAKASFYGPGFYGRGLACPGVLTTDLVGVAHRTLPCGTLVTFKNPANGRILTMPVVDRGPYVAGRDWDLTGGACLVLDFCYTGTIYWHLGPEPGQ